MASVNFFIRESTGLDACSRWLCKQSFLREFHMHLTLYSCEKFPVIFTSKSLQCISLQMNFTWINFVIFSLWSSCDFHMFNIKFTLNSHELSCTWVSRVSSYGAEFLWVSHESKFKWNWSEWNSPVNKIVYKNHAALNLFDCVRSINYK